MLEADAIRALALNALEELKAFDIVVIDVREQTDVTDTLVVASGSSDRQVKAIAREVIENSKAQGLQPLGVEGQREGEWILIDLYDVVVHVMLPKVRDFYQIEKLWTDNNSSAHNHTP